MKRDIHEVNKHILKAFAPIDGNSITDISDGKTKACINEDYFISIRSRERRPENDTEQFTISKEKISVLLKNASQHKKELAFSVMIEHTPNDISYLYFTYEQYRSISQTDTLTIYINKGLAYYESKGFFTLKISKEVPKKEAKGVFFNDPNFIPKSIRILPMTDDLTLEPEFNGKTGRDLQSFFFRDEIGTNGVYQYRLRSIPSLEDTLVLFQFKSFLIGACLLKEKVVYEEEANGYNGCYLFKPETLCIFDPISEKDLEKATGKNRLFRQVLHDIPVDQYNSILNLMLRKNVR
jgi:hypothetical protein